MEVYLPILLLFFLGLTVCIGVYATSLLGPKNPLAVKLSVYECGVKPEGGAHQPFKNRFYLIAVLFLLFDVEAAFFFPWALVYKESLAFGPELLIAMAVYMLLMVVGLIYILKKDCLELT